jgi:hypothetical protein
MVLYPPGWLSVVRAYCIEVFVEKHLWKNMPRCRSHSSDLLGPLVAPPAFVE